MSKGNDFKDLSAVLGFPSKVIWVSVSNAGTRAAQEFLPGERARIERSGQNEEASLLVLSTGDRGM